MALFLEDSEKVTQKQIPIPQKSKEVFKAMDMLYKPYEDKAEGGHVLKSLASDKQYNKKGEKAVKNGQTGNTDTVSVEDAKKRLERMDKFAPNTPQYQMYGGQLGHDIYKKGIEKARRINTVSPVKPVMPTAQGATKPAGVETKEISKPNGKITYNVTAESKKIYVTESQVMKIKENQDK